MSRKVKKSRTKQRPAETSPRLAGLGPLLPVIAVMGVIIVTVGGLEMLRAHVLNAPEHNPKLALTLQYPAGCEWVEQEGWLPRITRAISLPGDGQLMSDDLLSNVAKKLMASGWVRKVYSVSRDMDGTVKACCEYRRPIAMLLTPMGKYIPVDKEGVRLPEEYDRVETDSGWMQIIGVQTPPPAMGHAYGEDNRSAADAVAAIRLAALLFSREEISSRICGIDVRNFNGRENKYKDHILLRTREGGTIVWGSAIGREVEEPTVADKLRNLVLCLRRGSPQANAEVNLSVYRNGVLVPAAH